VVENRQEHTLKNDRKKIVRGMSFGVGSIGAYGLVQGNYWLIGLAVVLAVIVEVAPPLSGRRGCTGRPSLAHPISAVSPMQMRSGG
jgi:hypothetical protein